MSKPLDAVNRCSALLGSHTPTAIGPDGRVYAVNNARLFSIGA